MFTTTKSQHPEARKCQHCGKDYDKTRLITSIFCPHCSGNLTKPPLPKGTYIDPESVKRKELVRIDNWALTIMSKYEHLLKPEIPPGTIVLKEQLKAEDVDIPQIYDFTGLHYQIYKRYDGVWAIRIMKDNKMLIEAGYANL